VLIAHLDQLHNFVHHIPPLAWELLEYASEPLEIVYPERKPALIRADQPSSICVRWVKQPQLLRLVQKEGPLWAVYPLSTEAADALPWKKVDCSSKRYPCQKVKTVVLSSDDTFRFLR
jgi:tRNA A37 threonylcarbamoyladenosine synthetase subunit TsaC/SUA5/YrdC